MQNSLAVYVFEPHAYLQKDLPYFLLFEWSACLLLQHQRQVSTIAIFHYDVQAVLVDKRFVVANNKWILQFRKDAGFVD